MPDAPWYGLLVTWGSDARMFVVRQGQDIAALTEFCRDRYDIGGGALAIREWGGKLFRPSDPVPPEGTPLVLHRT